MIRVPGFIQLPAVVVALALLSAPLQAAPSPRFLVLNSSSSVTHGDHATLKSGLTWAGEDVIHIPAGESLTLLELGKGKRWTATGPATLKLEQGSLSARGGNLVETRTRHGSYSLSGQNDRRIAGQVVRGDSLSDAPPTQLVLSSVGSELQPELQFEYRGQTPPPRIQVYGYPFFYAPRLAPDPNGGLIGGQRMLTHDAYDDQTGQALGEATGESVNGKVVYQLKPLYPQVRGEAIKAIRVVEEPRGGTSAPKELLHASLQFPSPEHEAELAKARADADAWSKEEPSSAEPWLVLGLKLYDSGRLLEARDILTRATRLRPADVGIKELLQQVYYELGDVSGAQGVSAPD